MRPRSLGTLGGNRDFHRRDPVVDWRSQWLDAPHGPGTHGGSATCSRPSSLDSPSKVCRLRDHRLGDPVDCPGVDPGRRTSGFQSILVVGLSTMAAVIPYAFCAMAAGLVAAHGAGETVPRVTIIEIIAFVFAVFTLYGCGAEAVLYGVVLGLGIPVYVWQRRRAGSVRRLRRSSNPPSFDPDQCLLRIHSIQ